MSHGLLTYGTLMDEDIMHRVSGYRLKGEHATIHGYRRHAINEATYPAIIAAEGESVVGRLYRQVPWAAWKRLDEFEGRMYRRQRYDFQESPALQVDVYVLRSEYHHLLAQHDWDFQEFLRWHKSAYLV